MDLTDSLLRNMEKVTTIPDFDLSELCEQFGIIDDTGLNLNTEKLTDGHVQLTNLEPAAGGPYITQDSSSIFMGIVAPQESVVEPSAVSQSLQGAANWTLLDMVEGCGDDFQLVSPQEVCGIRPVQAAEMELQQKSYIMQGSPISHETVVMDLPASPAQVIRSPPCETGLQEETAVVKQPKKRGRKPKSENGGGPSRRRRPRKIKAYEKPLQADEVEEKKRQNAINAKRHRDRQKQERQERENTLGAVIQERDNLRMEVENLRQRELELVQKIRAMQDSMVVMVTSPNV